MTLTSFIGFIFVAKEYRSSRIIQPRAFCTLTNIKCKKINILLIQAI